MAVIDRCRRTGLRENRQLSREVGRCGGAQDGLHLTLPAEEGAELAHALVAVANRKGPTRSRLISTRGVELRTYSTRLAIGSTDREVPNTSKRSQDPKSRLLYHVNFNGSFSPKNTIPGFTSPPHLQWGMTPFAKHNSTYFIEYFSLQATQQHDSILPCV